MVPLCSFSFIFLCLALFVAQVYIYLAPPHVLLSFVLSRNPTLYCLCVVAAKWDLVSLHSTQGEPLLCQGPPHTLISLSPWCAAMQPVILC